MPATKGHWPKGKPRNATSADWPTVRRNLLRLLQSPTTNRWQRVPAAARQSRRGLSYALGVSERTVRRWLSGRCMPRKSDVAIMRRWILRRDT